MNTPTNVDLVSALTEVSMQRAVKDLENTAFQTWKAITEDISAVAHYPETWDQRQRRELEEKFGKDEDYIPPVEDMTVLVYDRADFIAGVDRDDMVPALVLCDRNADNLLRKVVETSLEKLQTYLGTGVMPGTDYILFDQVTVDEGEEDAELVISPAAKTVIDKMIGNTDRFLMETVTPDVLRDADLTTVNINAKRLEIVISK